jgi:hypothetical protein
VLPILPSVHCLGFAYARFSFSIGKKRGQGRATRKPIDETPARAAVPSLPLPRLRLSFSSAAQFRAIVKLEAIVTLKSIPFMVMLIAGIALVVGNTLDSDWLVASYPVTRRMADVIRSAFAVFALLIAAFYAGETSSGGSGRSSSTK